MAQSLAAWAIAGSSIALLGWVGNWPMLTTLGVGHAKMSVATALAIIGVGFGALMLARRPGASQAYASAGGGVALLLAGYALLRRFSGQVDAGAIFGPALGVMSLATSICLVLAAAAILAGTFRQYRLAGTLATIGILICGTDLVGHLYDVSSLHRFSPFADMSLPSAMSLILVYLAVLAGHPEHNWMRYILHGGQAGRAFRLLFPTVIILPPLIDVLISIAIDQSNLVSPFGRALLITAMMVLLAAVVWLTTAWIARSETASERLAAIVESTEDAVVSKSLEGVILSWNEGAERLFGYRASEAIGQPMRMVIPAEHADEEAGLLGRVRHGELVASFETFRRHRDGKIFDASVTLSPVRDAFGAIIAASSITRDLTELKRRDRELQRSNAELEQFAYIASHDLQEPLRMVANYTELLADRYSGKLDERADKYIHFAADGARRMQRLVIDLLAFSRVGSEGKPLEPVDSGVVMHHVVRSLAKRIEESRSLIVFGELPRVMADEVQLTQLLQNLITNAIKFRDDADPRIALAANREGGVWHFTVADNGIGIDMRHAPKIFQMFQRLHGRGEYEGSGIGLSIVKRIVERHGGSIWLESIPGEGTTFHFTLTAACP